MMREIDQRALAGQPDIAVTANGSAPMAGAYDTHSMAWDEAHVIVTSATDPFDRELPEELLDFPRHRVLVLAADGRDAVLHEPRLIPALYPDVQPAELLAAIRSGYQSSLQ